MPRAVPVCLVLGYFVLKLAPVQSIFRTKFCPALGLFFSSLRGEQCPVQPRSWPGLGPQHRHPPIFIRSTQCFLSACRLPLSDSRIIIYSRGYMNIQNDFKISPRLRPVPLSPRYQELNSSMNFLILFYQIRMARAGPFLL